MNRTNWKVYTYNTYNKSKIFSRRRKIEYLILSEIGVYYTDRKVLLFREVFFLLSRRVIIILNNTFTFVQHFGSTKVSKDFNTPHLAVFDFLISVEICQSVMDKLKDINCTYFF